MGDKSASSDGSTTNPGIKGDATEVAVGVSLGFGQPLLAVIGALSVLLLREKNRKRDAVGLQGEVIPGGAVKKDRRPGPCCIPDNWQRQS